MVIMMMKKNNNSSSSNNNTSEIIKETHDLDLRSCFCFYYINLVTLVYSFSTILVKRRSISTSDRILKLGSSTVTRPISKSAGLNSRERTLAKVPTANSKVSSIVLPTWRVSMPKVVEGPSFNFFSKAF